MDTIGCMAYLFLITFKINKVLPNYILKQFLQIQDFKFVNIIGIKIGSTVLVRLKTCLYVERGALEISNCRLKVKTQKSVLCRSL